MSHAAAKRPPSYARARAVGVREEWERWTRAAYVILKCARCNQMLIVGEPGCMYCRPIRALGEGRFK